jgi:CubicO group peptidase (beta-lactamase class C family)
MINNISKRRRQIIIFTVTCFFLLLLPSSFLICRENLSLESKIDHFINSLPEYESFSGVIFISSGDNILINKGYGLANLSFSIPHTPDTKFWIGSITKSFVALLVMQLVEEGKISLDDKIAKYLPEFPPGKANKISIHNLLDHTSAIPHHYKGVKHFFQKHDKYFYSTTELLDLISNVPLVHEPGEKVTYSSFNYSLLGIILERVSGKSFPELLKERILNPLGMVNTGVENNLTVKKHMADGYMRGLNGLVHAYHGEMSPYFAAGDMYSTAQDLSRFIKVIGPDSQHLLAKKFKKLMMEKSYGYRMIKAKSPEGEPVTVISFGGSAYGFQSSAYRILEKDWCIIAFCNIQGPFITGEIVDKLGDFLAEVEKKSSSKQKQPLIKSSKSSTDMNPSFRIDPQTLKLLTGWYRDDKGNILGIFSEVDRLYRLRPWEFGVSKIYLNPMDENSFKLSTNPQVHYHFKKNSMDNSYKLLIYNQGKEHYSLYKLSDTQHFKLTEYKGHYCSLENQNTITLSTSKNQNNLLITPFLSRDNVQIKPLAKDLFGYPEGFIQFQRDETNRITGFVLKRPNIDGFFGSKFIKK